MNEYACKHLKDISEENENLRNMVAECRNARASDALASQASVRKAAKDNAMLLLELDLMEKRLMQTRAELERVTREKSK